MSDVGGGPMHVTISSAQHFQAEKAASTPLKRREGEQAWGMSPDVLLGYVMLVLAKFAPQAPNPGTLTF